jgi:hypothetical protein
MTNVKKLTQVLQNFKYLLTNGKHFTRENYFRLSNLENSKKLQLNKTDMNNLARKSMAH